MWFPKSSLPNRLTFKLHSFSFLVTGVGKKKSTQLSKKGDGEPVVCNQYIGHGAVTSDAIKKLDEKLDQLIKLLQPSPYAGNLRIYIFHSNTQRSYL